MSHDYDAIGQDYARAKLAPWRDVIERHTLFDLLGDVSDRTVLDLACGSGFYTRMLRQAGAATVVGVDLSDEMIGLANLTEAAEPLGITYHVGDATQLALGETFDVVFAAYLFNYARTAEQLTAMCHTVTRHLRPGGRLVAVVNNPEQSPAGFEVIRKYGLTKSAVLPLVEGAAITYTLYPATGQPFSFDNYYVSLATHHRAFHAAGWREVSWHLPRVAAQGEAGYWDDFLADPPVIFLTARR